MFNNLIGKNKELGRFLFCERYTPPPVKNAMYIAEGQDLKRGAVVDVNGVLVGTNSLMPYAVLEFDCDTRDGGKEASVFIKGEFNFDKLSFADGLSKDDMDNIVYNGSGIGIVIKPYAFDKEFSPQLAELAELFFLNVKNIEVPSKKARVGDAVYADSDGNVHFIAGKSIEAASIPQGWTYVGAVAIRNGSKVKILYKSTNTSKWTNCWLFKINGLKLDGTDSMVMQQGKSSSSGAVEVGTFTASAAATDLDTFVDELNAWLLDNPTAEGAYANYGWHSAKMKDAAGVDSCFIIVDNVANQTIVSPIKSSTSGANSEFYHWQYAGFSKDAQTCKRKDGVNTYAVVWNKERFKQSNQNVNNPKDSLTTTGLFNEESFNATTVVKEHYGTYDNYLDYMMVDESSEEGVFGEYGNIDSKEVSAKLAAVKYTSIVGQESPVFITESFAASIDAGAEGLGAGDFYVPSISEAYEILSHMKTDGSDPVNLTMTKAGESAISLSTGMWIPARWNYYGTWRFENTGAFYAFSLFAVFLTIAIAELDVTE